MKFRYEFNGNHEYVTLHVTERLIDSDFYNKTIKVMRDDPKARELLTLMSGARGVQEVSIRPYEITARRGSAFDRLEVLDSLRDQLKIWFEVQGLREDWTQLPTLRSDILGHQCAQCAQEQAELMRRLAGDFDTLEY